MTGYKKAVVPLPLSIHGTMGKELLGMRSLTKFYFCSTCSKHRTSLKTA